MSRRSNRTPRFDSRDPLLDAPVSSTVDLHGLAVHEAERVVRGTVENWHRRGGGVIHFITGKGRGSVAGPVLRRTVRALLQRELKPHVADFAVDADEGGYKVRVR